MYELENMNYVILVIPHMSSLLLHLHLKLTLLIHKQPKGGNNLGVRWWMKEVARVGKFTETESGAATATLMATDFYFFKTKRVHSDGGNGCRTM